MNRERQIVPGLYLSASGQAIIDPSIADTLFDLAIGLEEPTGLPVDVEHGVAARVLAVRSGALDSTTTLTADDRNLQEVLVPLVQRVFRDYGGKLGADD